MNPTDEAKLREYDERKVKLTAWFGDHFAYQRSVYDPFIWPHLCAGRAALVLKEIGLGDPLPEIQRNRDKR